MNSADRERFRQHIQARRASRPVRLISPDPPPRYDQVYALGTAWLDSPQDQDGEPSVRPR